MKWQDFARLSGSALPRADRVSYANRKSGNECRRLNTDFCATGRAVRSFLVVAALGLTGCAESQTALNTTAAIEARNATITDRAVNDARSCSTRGGAWRYPGFNLANHVIVSDSEGDIASHDLSLIRAFKTITHGIQDWSTVRQDEMRRAGVAGPLRVAFYFNGGLNPWESVLDQAQEQVPCMLADGIYPVFFVWDTNGQRSYEEQVFHIRNGVVTAKTQYLTGPMYIFGDIAEGLGRTPSDYAIHGARYFSAVRRSRPCLQVVLATEDPANDCAPGQKVDFLNATPDSSIDAQHNVVDEGHDVLVNRARVDEHRLEIPENVVYGLLWPTRLISTPFAHGIGQTAWDNFVRRSRTTVRRPAEFDLDRTIPPRCKDVIAEDMKNFPQGTGAFAKFFHLLALTHGKPSDAKETIGNLPPELTCNEAGRAQTEPSPVPPTTEELRQFKSLPLQYIMIGHSMGTIVLNELLWRFRDIPYSDIVYMAAAASIRDSRRTIETVLEYWPERRFYNLMLHPLNDMRERMYYGFVPSGSLLMWIDEMYEPAKTPEDRTLGYWPNAKGARFSFQERLRKQILYRVFDRPPAVDVGFSGDTETCEKDAGARDPLCQPANPTVHGAFNDDVMCFWRPEYWGASHTNWRKQFEDLPAQAQESCLVRPRK